MMIIEISEALIATSDKFLELGNTTKALETNEANWEKRAAKIKLYFMPNVFKPNAFQKLTLWLC